MTIDFDFTKLSDRLVRLMVGYLLDQASVVSRSLHQQLTAESVRRTRIQAGEAAPAVALSLPRLALQDVADGLRDMEQLASCLETACTVVKGAQAQAEFTEALEFSYAVERAIAAARRELLAANEKPTN